MRRRRRTAAETLTAASTQLFFLKQCSVTLVRHVDCDGTLSHRLSRRAVASIVTARRHGDRDGLQGADAGPDFSRMGAMLLEELIGSIALDLIVGARRLVGSTHVGW